MVVETKMQLLLTNVIGHGVFLGSPTPAAFFRPWRSKLVVSFVLLLTFHWDVQHKNYSWWPKYGTINTVK